MGKLNGGVWPTMITPFTVDCKIDWKKLEQLIEWYISSGVSGLFAVCLSSEIFHLTEDEKIKLADFIVKKVNGKVQTVSGILLTDSNIPDKVKQVYDLGVDAVVFLTGQLFPQNKTLHEAFIEINKILSKTANIPLGIYESPLPYHKTLLPEEFKRLVSTNRFYFMKDTSCDIDLIKQKIELSSKTNCNFFNANTPTLFESLKFDVSGYSGIAANFYPELYVWLCKNFKAKPKLSQELSDFLRIVDPLIHTKYPLSAKIYQSINGINVNPLCRSNNIKMIPSEISSLESLNRILKQWHEYLNIK